MIFKELCIIANALDEAGLYRLATRVDSLLKEAINYETELAGTRGGRTLRSIRGMLYEHGVPKEELDQRSERIANGLYDTLARIVKDMPDDMRGPVLVWARRAILADTQFLLSLESGGDSVIEKRLASNLTKYVNLRNYMSGDAADLLKIPDFENLVKAISDAVAAKLQRGFTGAETRQRASVGSRVVAENDQWIVYSPENEDASKKLGRGTRWCTSVDSVTCQYDDYVIQGPLYIIISKQNPNEKYQFHIETGSLRDSENRTPNPKRLIGRGLEFIYDIPELKGKLKPVGDTDADPRGVSDFMGNTGTVDKHGELHSYNDKPSLVLVSGEQHFHNHGDLYKKVYVDGLTELFRNGERYAAISAAGDRTEYVGNKISAVIDSSGKRLDYRDGVPWSGSTTDFTGATIIYEDGRVVKRIGTDGKTYLYENGNLVGVK